ncbi:MAG: redox-regulated ATPase YchF [Syntrophomonadaceae bacterium]|jgi:GTP-binding protein YchF
MQLGIIGLPLVGKTTIFELMTESKVKTPGVGKANTAMARVPDYRVDWLSALYKPKKTTYAQLELVDIPGLSPGSEKAAVVFLDAVRKADALLHVVRIFTDENVPYLGDAINPLGDIENIHYELLLADLGLVERRIQRIEASKKKKGQEKELALLSKLQQALENEQALSNVELDGEEEELLLSYQFLTSKPLLVCLNIGEDHLMQGTYPGKDKVVAYLHSHQLPYVEVSASIERDIAELDGDERQEFMHELGLQESGMVRVARTVYESLDLLSFFTVGEDEVKAWTIDSGCSARKAAGKIHSDIERGFIRAEVVAFQDLYTLGTMAAVKEKGLFRLEGKEYQVLDGDIIHFRFNV